MAPARKPVVLLRVHAYPPFARPGGIVAIAAPLQGVIASLLLRSLSHFCDERIELAPWVPGSAPHLVVAQHLARATLWPLFSQGGLMDSR